jgi:hypothetical protein
MNKRLLCAVAAAAFLLAGCASRTGTTTAAPDTVATPSVPVSDSASGPPIGVNHPSSKSPDGKYLAEAYGMNTGVTAGGLYPAEGIRLTEISSGKVLWQTSGYYDTAFLWSPDNRYLALTNATRIEFSTAIVDLKDFTNTAVPIPDEIQKQMRSFRADPYVKAGEWRDDGGLLVTIQWVGSDETVYKGMYIFNPSTGKIADISYHTDNNG